MMMKVNKYTVWLIVAFWYNNSLLQGTFAYNDDKLASSSSQSSLRKRETTGFLHVVASSGETTEDVADEEVELVVEEEEGGLLLGLFRHLRVLKEKKDKDQNIFKKKKDKDKKKKDKDKKKKDKDKKKKNKDEKKKKKKDDPDDDPDDCVGFSFTSAWTIVGDFFELRLTPCCSGELIETFGPFAEDRFNWESSELCLDPNLCYLFIAYDRHDGMPFGYPPSDVTYDGQTFFCTGEGDRGDEDTCTFGNGCP